VRRGRLELPERLDGRLAGGLELGFAEVGLVPVAGLAPAAAVAPAAGTETTTGGTAELAPWPVGVVPPGAALAGGGLDAGVPVGLPLGVRFGLAGTPRVVRELRRDALLKVSSGSD
jgi:hypothetical protein